MSGVCLDVFVPYSCVLCVLSWITLSGVNDRTAGVQGAVEMCRAVRPCILRRSRSRWLVH